MREIEISVLEKNLEKIKAKCEKVVQMIEKYGLDSRLIKLV